MPSESVSIPSCLSKLLLSPKGRVFDPFHQSANHTYIDIKLHYATFTVYRIRVSQFHNQTHTSTCSGGGLTLLLLLVISILSLIVLNPPAPEPIGCLSSKSPHDPPCPCISSPAGSRTDMTGTSNPSPCGPLYDDCEGEDSDDSVEES